MANLSKLRARYARAKLRAVLKGMPRMALVVGPPATAKGYWKVELTDGTLLLPATRSKRAAMAYAAETNARRSYYDVFAKQTVKL